MNINKAIDHLNINSYYKNNINELSLTELKKAYHISALNNHPDKSNNSDSNEIFININDSYNYLLNIISNSYSVG